MFYYYYYYYYYYYFVEEHTRERTVIVECRTYSCIEVHTICHRCNTHPMDNIKLTKMFIFRIETNFTEMPFKTVILFNMQNVFHILYLHIPTYT